MSKQHSKSVDIYVSGTKNQYADGYTAGRLSLSHLHETNRGLIERINAMHYKLEQFNEIIRLAKEVF